MLTLKDVSYPPGASGCSIYFYLKGIVANNNKTIDDGEMVNYK
jgi:hypothetical protein